MTMRGSKSPMAMGVTYDRYRAANNNYKKVMLSSTNKSKSMSR